MLQPEYAFGPFRYDPRLHLLSRDDVLLPIGRRAALILNALLAQDGQIVEKAALLDAAWPDENVEESNLSVQVAKLRRVLGSPDWIRTVERVGYQFVPRTTSISNFPCPQRLIIAPLAAGRDIARDIVALADEGLIEALTQFGSLAVAAAKPGLQWAPGYRLEGSLRTFDQRLRIAVRLVVLETGRYLWAGSVTPRRGEVTGALQQVVGQIAAELNSAIANAELARAGFERRESPTAHDLYLQGRLRARSLDPADNAVAVTLFDRALQRQPDNVIILAGASEARYHRIAMGWGPLGPEDQALGIELALRGLTRPDADADATALFGGLLYKSGDLDRGLALTRQAASRNPNSLTAMIYAGTAAMQWGNMVEAEVLYRRALRLDPHNWAQVYVLGGLARIRMMQGRFEQALVWAERAFQTYPNYGGTHWTLIAAAAHLGRREQAAACLRRFRLLQPEASIAGIRSGNPTRQARMNSTLEGLAEAGMQ